MAARQRPKPQAGTDTRRKAARPARKTQAPAAKPAAGAPAATQRLQMSDIARLAGVSVSTVSRALAGGKPVKEDTQRRIQDLARSLGYSINIGAQRLRLGENRTVAVVIPYNSVNHQSVTDPFFLSILGSLADALEERRRDLLLSRVDEDDLQSVERIYRAGRAGGLIIVGQWHRHDDLNAMAVRGVPFVVWGAQLGNQLYCTVGSNNEAGGYQATSHLLQSGRRRVLFLGDTALPEVAQRYAGYLRAHEHAGLKADPQLLCKAPFLPEAGRAAVERAVTSGGSFDALFAASDVLAINAISELSRNGYRVPDDVAVVGFDDVPLAEHFHPALSTVRQKIPQAGAALVAALETLMQGGKPGSIQLETQLVVRASSFVA